MKKSSFCSIGHKSMTLYICVRVSPHIVHHVSVSMNHTYNTGWAISNMVVRNLNISTSYLSIDAEISTSNRSLLNVCFRSHDHRSITFSIYEDQHQQGFLIVTDLTTCYRTTYTVHVFQNLYFPIHSQLTRVMCYSEPEIRVYV